MHRRNRWKSEQAPNGSKMAASFARNGHINVLKWLVERGCCLDKWTIIGAARGGHIEVLEWLRETGNIDLYRSDMQD